MKRVIILNKVMSITQGSIIDTKDLVGEKRGDYRRKINIRQEDGSVLELQLFSDNKEKLRPNSEGYAEADSLMYEKSDETIEIISQ